MSLGAGIDKKAIGEIIEARGKSGISDLNKLNPLLQKLNIRSEQITIESQYFMAVAQVSSDDLQLKSYTILRRKKDKDGTFKVAIIGESFNTFN